jgi:hypothetical protein
LVGCGEREGKVKTGGRRGRSRFVYRVEHPFVIPVIEV